MACWLLDLQKAKQCMEPSSIWSKYILPLPVMSKFATVLEPTGQELLLIGGRQFGSISSNVLKIQIRIPTLMSLAIDCIARNTCSFDRSLQLDELPFLLQKEILVCKEEIIGVESVCTEEEGCGKCQIEPPKKLRRKS